MSTPSSSFVSSIEPTVGSVQTLTYRDDGSQWEVTIPSQREATRDITPVGDVALENFLGRPIILPAKTWTPGVPGFVYQFNPWTTFFGNKRVSNRLNNFFLLTCDLCVKVMINGNGFYYGRLMMDYRFASGFDVVEIDNGTVAAAATQASQRMHLFIDPTTSQGGVMRIPFFSLRNAFNVCGGDWETLGGLVTVRELNPLKHANGATTPVELTFTVWAENVKLSVPTNIGAYGLTAQAGDEEKDGAVSRTASAVANAASFLSKVPVIGPYATATSMVAKGLGGMARQFGFSRPPVLEDPAPVRPTYIGNMVNGDARDNVTKLTLDSKQELTIDPSVIGLSLPDEMSINALITKETYLTTFPWLVSRTTDDILWNARVTPAMYVFTGSSYYLPACTFASYPFAYWRGCMKYRFQLVASQFHRGRIKIIWDPNLIPLAPEANVQYTRVIDISTERDVEVVVRWGQTSTWLKNSGLALSNHGTTRLTSTDELAYNGLLSVQVLNSLTTPNSVANNDIGVNVYVSMEEGEFAVPTDSVYKTLGTTYQLTVQSGEEEIAPVNNDPEPPPVTEDISECTTAPGQNQVFIGEVFSSFRTLLKRYHYYRTDLCPNTSASALWILRSPNFPSFRGYAAATHDASATAKKVNYVVPTLLNYLAPAFTVARGGIRWKAVLYTAAPNEVLSPLTVERGADTTTAYSDTTTDFNALGITTAMVANNNAVFRTGLVKGATMTPFSQQPVLEFELPFYAQERGLFTRMLTGLVASFGLNKYQHQYQLVTTGSTPKYLDRYVSTGEDFQLLLFQGCPPLQALTGLPPPA